MTDSREIFSGKEQQYDKNRPHYPARLIDFLYDEIGFCVGSVIADIGSGTGIFSKQLAERGSTVICVEPSAVNHRTIGESFEGSYSNHKNQ